MTEMKRENVEGIRPINGGKLMMKETIKTPGGNRSQAIIAIAQQITFRETIVQNVNKYIFKKYIY